MQKRGLLVLFIIPNNNLEKLIPFLFKKLLLTRIWGPISGQSEMADTG